MKRKPEEEFFWLLSPRANLGTQCAVFLGEWVDLGGWLSPSFYWVLLSPSFYWVLLSPSLYCLSKFFLLFQCLWLSPSFSATAPRWLSRSLPILTFSPTSALCHSHPQLARDAHHVKRRPLLKQGHWFGNPSVVSELGPYTLYTTILNVLEIWGQIAKWSNRLSSYLNNILLRCYSLWRGLNVRELPLVGFYLHWQCQREVGTTHWVCYPVGSLAML